MHNSMHGMVDYWRAYYKGRELVDKIWEVATLKQEESSMSTSNLPNSVTINGVVLTREQIDQAVKDLNTHIEPTFKGGDVVNFNGDRCIVMSEFLSKCTQKGTTLGFKSDRLMVVRCCDGAWMSPPKTEVTKMEKIR